MFLVNFCLVCKKKNFFNNFGRWNSFSTKNVSFSQKWMERNFFFLKALLKCVKMIRKTFRKILMITWKWAITNGSNDFRTLWKILNTYYNKNIRISLKYLLLDNKRFMCICNQQKKEKNMVCLLHLLKLKPSNQITIISKTKFQNDYFCIINSKLL